MAHLFSRLAAAIILLGCSAPAVLAQAGYTAPPRGPGARPTVSPYLNLGRLGNPALNYYNLVRPEFEFRNAYQGLQGQVNQQQQVVREIVEGELPPTGHTTRFLNYSHYYPGAGGGTGVTRAPGVAAPPPTPPVRGAVGPVRR